MISPLTAMAEFPPDPKTENTAPNPVQQAIENAERSAAETFDVGEECVSQHPVSSVTSSFIGGLVVGALIGWAIAESRHHFYRNACRELATDWIRRLHLD
jgi:hypothetical protein